MLLRFVSAAHPSADIAKQYYCHHVCRCSRLPKTSAQEIAGRRVFACWASRYLALTSYTRAAKRNGKLHARLVLIICQSRRTCQRYPTQLPQVTTEQLSRIAESALLEAWTWRTLFNRSCAPILWPPRSAHLTSQRNHQSGLQQSGRRWLGSESRSSADRPQMNCSASQFQDRAIALDGNKTPWRGQ